ncbi:hypothetical protein GH714_004505 [Hevea brasiliensis]|uniref:Protein DETOXIFICATION n=1 Tax=Hevea brasiliensis TaxID=3981 RepID=A0A6A6KH72_HEVBR|nr:hypothetical protein GH714_004505 [Hevea brasiliensis]
MQGLDRIKEAMEDCISFYISKDYSIWNPCSNTGFYWTYWRIRTCSLFNYANHRYAIRSRNAGRHVECNGDFVRSSFWSKAIPHDGYLLAAIMDHQFFYSNSHASCVYLLIANLQATGEKEDIANKAGEMSPWFIPYLYNLVFNQTIQKFLRTQLKNMIVGWLSAISFVLHLLLSWIFVVKLNLGIPGAMSSIIISSWFVVIGDFVYIFGGWCPETWKGFTLAAFSDLLPSLKLSISSGVMLCLELWYYSILVLLAGYMKNAKTAISAFSIWTMSLQHQRYRLGFMLCMGFLSATSVRVANELGRGEAKAAKFAIKVNVGAAIGAGRQSMAAYVNMCCYYTVGVPVGVILGFVAHLQVKGIWIGMILGEILQVITLGYITSRTNWEEQVEKASERLNRF